MTKEEFKRRWEFNDDGDGITYEDVAKCAKEWGLYQNPLICSMTEVTKKVLETAGCVIQPKKRKAKS